MWKGPIRWAGAEGLRTDTSLQPTTVVIMFGGNMGNPNPAKQAYTCQTCGEPRPPYQFYCDRHLKDGEKNDKPLLIDRFMKRLFGRS